MNVKGNPGKLIAVFLCLAATLLHISRGLAAIPLDPLETDIRGDKALLDNRRGLTAVPPDVVENDVRRDATVRAVEKVMPGVVNIATSRIIRYQDFYDTILREFYGLDRPEFRQQERLNSIGSGVIIDEEGFILTNLHVVRRAERTQVKLSNGRVYDADLVANSPQTDVALLKIRSEAGEKFQAVKLAHDDDVILGETVLALGNPFGLGGSVSRGILSSKNRNLRPLDGGDSLNIQDWLQTDASINPGNSGGPLINLKGELIGLNVAVYKEGQGIGFAIPIKLVSSALSEFFSPELTDSLWFGAKLRHGTMPLEVTFVQSGSPAEKAGIRSGQQVLKVDGKPVKNLVDFSRHMSEVKNQKVALEIQQGSAVETRTVQMIPFSEVIRQKLGLTLTDTPPETAPKYNGNAGVGLWIQEVEKDSLAERAQLQPGLLLNRIDGQATGSHQAAASILSTKKPGDTVQLTITVSRRRGPYLELRQANVNVKVR
jgi:serine protease Do